MKKALNSALSIIAVSLIFTSCQKIGNESSQLDTIASQPGLYLDGFILAQTNDEALFIKGEDFDSDGLIYESDFISHREAFPLEKNLLNVNPKAELIVATCSGRNFNRGSLNTCLNDTDRYLSRQKSFFADELVGIVDDSEKRKIVAKAIGEAIQLLTLNDLVQKCYVESVRETEAIENATVDPFAFPGESESLSLFEAAREELNPAYMKTECAIIPRTEWTSANCPTLKVYYNALMSVKEENAGKWQAPYLKRAFLGRRLGYRVDQSVPSHVNEEFNLYYPDAKELSKWDDDNLVVSNNPSERVFPSCGLGQDCFLGSPLQYYINQSHKNGIALARTADGKFYLSAQEQKTQNWDTEETRQKYADLLMAAVYLAKASDLKPKEMVYAMEMDSDQPSCDEVSQYSFGDRNRRFEYAGVIINGDQDKFISKTPQAEITLVDTQTGEVYPTGSRFSVEHTKDESCLKISNHRPPLGFSCPIRMQVKSGSLDRYKTIRLRYVFAGKEKVFEIDRDFFEYRSNVLDYPIAYALDKAGIFANSILYIEGLHSQSSQKRWELLGSFFISQSGEAQDKLISTPPQAEIDLVDTQTGAVYPTGSQFSVEHTKDESCLENLNRWNRLGFSCPIKMQVKSGSLSRYETIRLRYVFAGKEKVFEIDRDFFENRSNVLDYPIAYALEKAGIFANSDFYIEGLLSQDSKKRWELLGIFFMTQSGDLSSISESWTEVTSLDFSNFGELIDISFLENFSNLEKLVIRTNRITDISALKGLTNLTELNLMNNNIVDISPLQNLVDLQHLDLSSNQIQDISSLETMINLKHLNLSDNQVSEISTLSDLSDLKYLILSLNQITDFSPLNKLKNLETAYLFSNPIIDDRPVKELKERGVSVIW